VKERARGIYGTWFRVDLQEHASGFRVRIQGEYLSLRFGGLTRHVGLVEALGFSVWWFGI